MAGELASTGLDQHEISTLKNALLVAAERFREDASALRAVAGQGGNPMITASAASALAEGFDRQAEETSDLRAKIEEHTGVTLVIEE